MAEEKIQTLCQLPKGAMAIEVIEVCAFIDSEGGNRWIYRVSGDSPLSTTIGLLEIAKYDLLGRCMSSGEGE